MKPLKHGILMLAVVLLAGCASVQVSHDYDPDVNFSHFGTWQWKHPVQVPTGDIRIDNALLDDRIRRAIENHLLARMAPKISQTSTQPELYLSYHLLIEQKIQSATYFTTIGMSAYNYPWRDGALGTETRIRQYDESRLTIDIHSGETGGLLWRGVGVYRFKAYKTPQAAAAAFQMIVDKILSQFPPVGPK